MSQTPSYQPTPNEAAISRRAIVRSIIVATVLATGIASVRGLETALHATFDKPPAPLQKPLPYMHKELGDPVRYVAVGSDEILDSEVVETLGTTDYLVRQYRDETLAQQLPGALVNLNLNYYPTGSSTPHVPEICWAGSGRDEVGGARNIFEVKGVKRHDGSTVDLRMKMISFLPPAGDPTAAPSGEPMYSNVAYVFQVNGDYVAQTQEVMSRFWKASYKFAYHAKIEVTPIDPADPSGRKCLTCTQAQAQKIISDFIRESLASVEECLPDPEILTKGLPATDGGR
ncbi:MAG TPA: hypothetical protein VGN88_13815 [Phycisphaerae bacterium]|jgi:hypothetical protein